MLHMQMLCIWNYSYETHYGIYQNTIFTWVNEYIHWFYMYFNFLDTFHKFQKMYKKLRYEIDRNIYHQ